MASRRPPNPHVSVAERPRVKGWRDPEAYTETELPEAQGPRRAAPARRPATGESRERRIAAVGRLLTPQQIESIRAVMRLFLTDDLARGVPADVRLLCHACGATKWAAGYVLYGRTPFCNDCATDFEIARLRGRCDGAAEFLLQRTDRAAG